ncbi:hypothetical protein ACFL5K_01665 [Gemmatimonadota bacterium]
MSQYLDDFLAYISTTSGFILFVAVITMAYGGIWFLFLYEESTRQKKAAAKSEGGEKAEESEERPAEKQPA